MVKPISLNVDDVIDTKEDTDTKADHVTFQVTQTGEQSFSVRTLVDTSGDGFGTLSSDTVKTFKIDTTPDWRLSSLRFENNKLVLLGNKEGTSESIAIDQLVKVDAAAAKVEMQKQQLDKEIAENGGVLGALRDDGALDRTFGATGLGLHYDDMSAGIGGLIGTKGTQIGSGGLGATGSGLGGGGEAEGLGGLGTKGRGSGTSGYGSGGDFGTSSAGVLGAGDPILLGAMDKSLVDAVIKRNMAQIRSCYQKELPTTPDLKGTVTIKFTIAKDGTVSKAEIKTGQDSDGQEFTSWNHPEVGQRVGDAICARFLRFQFPEPKGGGIMIVSYPFNFSPE